MFRGEAGLPGGLVGGGQPHTPPAEARSSGGGCGGLEELSTRADPAPSTGVTQDPDKRLLQLLPQTIQLKI